MATDKLQKPRALMKVMLYSSSSSRSLAALLPHSTHRATLNTSQAAGAIMFMQCNKRRRHSLNNDHSKNATPIIG
ncbi:hypothetical protein E2C01_049127 [Portunus trituberculatus]|uniref:Uncharacterized protein n=1 Tax=Portunus trituberculatus TaxID=210409 RepID=A0A5B7GCC1_PORTR|nr:hypothetical protein [Portunus trituberculatus]